MQHVDVSRNGVVEATDTAERGAPYQAYQILHWGFVAVPTIAGLDKFTNVLTDWRQYLAPQFAHLSPLSAADTMRVIGVVEIVAALIVALKPKVGAYVVAAWLVGIIVDLFLRTGFYDVALRDFGLAVAAVALARLAARYDGRVLGLPRT